MRSGQRELRRVVVKRCAQPIHVCMAGGAVVRKSGSGVIWILSCVEIRDVAPKAVCRCSSKSSGNVTGRASQRGVRAHQLESGERRVIELRPLPPVHAVATLAFGGKLGRKVIG